MVRHIVFFKLADNLEPQEKNRQVQLIRESFQNLPETVPRIRDYKIGVNFNPKPFAWDVVIDSTFDTRDDLENYQKSREHQIAIQTASIVPKEKAVIDYEF